MEYPAEASYARLIALRKGGHSPWDYQPLQKASERYMRDHMDLDEVEKKQRFPRAE